MGFVYAKISILITNKSHLGHFFVLPLIAQHGSDITTQTSKLKFPSLWDQFWQFCFSDQFLKTSDVFLNLTMLTNSSLHHNVKSLKTGNQDQIYYNVSIEEVYIYHQTENWPISLWRHTKTTYCFNAKNHDRERGQVSKNNQTKN